ncbi:hypothetical protein BDV98DRAFT_562843 [Pterulicium gracile]|uniref:Uncharacterized protein n=1 Tax=Pterulicium gracile TaxID=1884261 RepID=A0A5C3R229_9AGAR|nr:hypothetical protein BDV98DRAFT_562843 [Pterula gracilis]
MVLLAVLLPQHGFISSASLPKMTHLSGDQPEHPQSNDISRCTAPGTAQCLRCKCSSVQYRFTSSMHGFNPLNCVSGPPLIDTARDSIIIYPARRK